MVNPMLRSCQFGPSHNASTEHARHFLRRSPPGFLRAVFLANAALAALLLVPSAGTAQTLGSAESFAIVGGSAVTAAGTGSIITGDVGVSPGTSITGFDGTSATISPPFSAHSNDGPAVAARSSVDTLYTTLLGTGGCAPLAAQLDNVTVPPGVYCFTTSADLAAMGTLTLDGSGTYIFQVGSSLTANVLSTVDLLNGADACDVFWQVSSAATLNGVNFVGNVVAQAGVTVGSNASLVGRALTTAAGAVTIAGGNSVGGCSAATPTPTAGPTPTLTPAVPTPTSSGQPTPVPTTPAVPTPTSSGQPTPVPTTPAVPTPTSSGQPTPVPTTTAVPTPPPFLIDDPFTSYTQPGNALVMPFDETDGHTTFFLVSNLSGVSPSGSGFLAGVTTHWAYWSDSCAHLADVYVCLTLNDTIVVSPAAASSVDAGNEPIGPGVDLSGHRGFVVVTAYATDENCGDASVRGYLPVDDAIVGSYTFANLASQSSFGNDAIGLGLDDSGSFTQLPGDGSIPSIEFDKFSIQTFNPETLDDSVVVLLSLRERSGNGATALLEVGPNTSNTRADVAYYDTLEIATSLPDTSIKCAEFTSLIPGDGSLIPDSISLLSSGVLRLDGFTPAIGGDTGRFIFGIHGQAVGNFGGSSNMKYRVAAIE